MSELDTGVESLLTQWTAWNESVEKKGTGVLEGFDEFAQDDYGQHASSRRRFLGRAAGTAAVSLGVVGASMATKGTPARAAGSGPISVNIVTDYGADPTGNSDSTQAIQNAINAAIASFTQPFGITTHSKVYVPTGNYLISAPISIPHTVRLTGDGKGSRIFSNTSGIIDFANQFVYGMEIDNLTLDATGGDIFANANLHKSSFHDLQLAQRSGNYSIWNFGSGASGLSTTHFDRINSYAYCDPTTFKRTVAAWYMYNPGAKVIDVVHFSQCTNFNASPQNPNTGNAYGPVDYTQYFFDIACTGTGSAASMDRIFFTQCDFDSPLGGAIRVLSCSGLVLDQIGVGNLAPSGNQTNNVGQSTNMIRIGEFNNASQQAVIRNYVREGGGNIGVGSTPCDIYIGSTTKNTTITAPCAVDTAPGIQINLNGSAGAVVINPQTGYALNGQASDTVVVG